MASDTRIVVISAWAGEHRAVLQELGVTTVLQKPLRLQQLTTLIDETLFSRGSLTLPIVARFGHVLLTVSPVSPWPQPRSFHQQ